MLNRTIHGRPLHWFKSLNEYYFREEWELYDLENDPQELVNLHNKKKYRVKIVFNLLVLGLNLRKP